MLDPLIKSLTWASLVDHDHDHDHVVFQSRTSGWGWSQQEAWSPFCWSSCSRCSSAAVSVDTKMTTSKWQNIGVPGSPLSCGLRKRKSLKLLSNAKLAPRWVRPNMPLLWMYLDLYGVVPNSYNCSNSKKAKRILCGRFSRISTKLPRIPLRRQKLPKVVGKSHSSAAVCCCVFMQSLLVLVQPSRSISRGFFNSQLPSGTVEVLENTHEGHAGA